MVKILDYTTKNPLQMIGEMSGICWHSPIDDSEKNINRALNCIKSNHGRTEEFPDVYMSITGYSARCLRELYTHIGGAPTRLQASTRYCNCAEFEYFDPSTSEEQRKIFKETMDTIKENYTKLLENGMSKEDAANILPLGMYSEMVWKVNLRTLINFMNQRMCSRAYKEIRELANEISEKLSEYSPEWLKVSRMLFVPKCEMLGKCPEEKSCGRKGK